MKKSLSRPLIIFYVLVAYIFIQFSWWAFHIYNLHSVIHHLRLEQGIDSNISSRLWMVIGEGLVFLSLLTIGVIITRNSFKKEVALGNQQKNFLLSVTHELKSPIASVKLYLETLLKRDLEKERQTEILSNTLNETERLLWLVENILSSAKIESGNFPLYREPLNLSEFTDQVVSFPITRYHGQKSQKFILETGKNIFLNIDKQAYSSIILNLLENAVKYSPPGSKISLQLKSANNQVKLSVKDEGPGIPDEEKENIFNKFYRIGNEETRRTKGTGLGLYIVKNLVEQLGGTISIWNNTPSGSIFEVVLKK